MARRGSPLEALNAQRSTNLRQLLLSTSRIVNLKMTAELIRRGHKRFRITHFNLYSNIDFDGTRLNVLATRANISKQAMWLLANDLERLGYVSRRVDPEDRRNRIIALTDKGNELMLECIDALKDIEADLAELVGSKAYGSLRDTLGAISHERPRAKKAETYSRRPRSLSAKRSQG